MAPYVLALMVRPILNFNLKRGIILTAFLNYLTKSARCCCKAVIEIHVIVLVLMCCGWPVNWVTNFFVITTGVWLVLFMVILFKIPLKKLSPCVELLRPYMELFQYNLFVMVELQNSNAPTKNILKVKLRAFVLWITCILIKYGFKQYNLLK